MNRYTKTIQVPNGTLVWRMGTMWGILSPNSDGTYSSQNIRHSPLMPVGITSFRIGKGSAKRSLQIIGTPLTDIDTDVDMGWVKAHVSYKDGQATIEFKGGIEAVTKRWAMGIPSRPRVHKPKYPIYNQEDSNNMLPLTTSARERQVHNKVQWDWLRSEVYIRDKGICWVCNEFVLLRDYELGHLIDRSNGGNDKLENCAVMHKVCNISKPRHKSIAEASTWRLTSKNIRTHSVPEPPPFERQQLSSNLIS